MSTVYRCDDLVLKRIVAVKVLHIDVAEAPQALRRLQTEGQAIARFQHKNIIQPYGAAVTLDGVPYLVTEVVNGQSLFTLLKGGQLKWARTLNLISQICDALAHAHSHGVVHRDLKPSNIMVENVGKPTESIKLLDFGIAKLTADTAGSGTQAGAIFGTPAYMSPEQAEGLSGDARSDQYAVGCLLYEMLCGVPPFEGEAALQMLMQHRHAEVPSISENSADTLPKYVETVYQRMMQKNPDHRYQSISEAKNALMGIKQKKVGFAALIIGLVVVCVIGGGVWYATQKPAPSPDAKFFKDYSDFKKSNNFMEPMSSFVDNNDEEVKLLYQKYPETTKLDLAEKSFTINGIQVISRFSHLKILSFWHAGGIDNGALRMLKDLPLEKLDVTKTSITDDGMPYIGNMKKLRSLIMSTVNVHDRGLQYIANLHELEYLMINRLTLTEKSIPLLNKLPLKALFIEGVYDFKNHMAELNLPQLEQLSVRGIAFDDKSVQVLAQFPKLVELSVAEIDDLSAKGVIKLVKHLKHLRLLDISKTAVKEEDLPSIREAVPVGCKIRLVRKRNNGMRLFGADKDGALRSFTKFGIDEEESKPNDQLKP